ncbi:amino acid ABC transporter permease [Pandoraea cepalis]|uniref:Amino acid ABC transporter permease n=2 Tax=Pandoraea cepalis TaxID=2508294 RepID=A0A5E4TD14_9BURK|nr:amino acid ABC transporter permease [Pandoraea cepalis]
MATRYTLMLSVGALVGGSLLGLVVLMLRTSKVGVFVRIAIGFTTIFQSTPLLMQMFLAFFGLALFGFDVPAWLAASTALTLWSAAFLSDIWRGCVEAIPRGQWEASSSLAMTYTEQMMYVVLPQAIRIAIPPTVGFSVQIVKSTAIASIVGFAELSKTGATIMNATFDPLTVYGCTGAIYFCLCWLLTRTSAVLERKLHVAHRN